MTTTTMGEIVAQRAHLDPHLEALVDLPTGRRITFAELDELVTDSALRLLAAGGTRGDRVALLMSNSADFVIWYLAAARSGIVSVPLNTRLSPVELVTIIGDSGAELLLCDRDHLAQGADVMKQGGTALRTLATVGMGGEREEGSLDLARLKIDSSSAPVRWDVDDDDLLYIMYTSGTTGLPKGVMHTHATAFGSSLSVCTTDYRRYDRYLSALPLFHVGALGPLNTCLYRGITTVLLGPFDPELAWKVIAGESITIFVSVPTVLDALASAYDPTRHKSGSLRWIVAGGAPVPLELLDRFAGLGIEVHQGYGLTEAGPVTALDGRSASDNIGKAGKAYFHVEVEVWGPDGARVPVDEPGEVMVRSSAVTVGYWNNPEASVRDITPEGWLHTGDIGVMDAEGYLTICDRKKDVVISGGENIYSVEVENVLLAHPGVMGAAVVGQRSPRWGEVPVAIVERGSDTLVAEDLTSWCRARLAKFKVPVSVEFVDQLPRNPAGKVLKGVLRERYSAPAPADG